MEDVYFFRAPSPLPLPAGGLLVWIGPRPLTGEGNGNGGGGGMSSTATRRRSSSVTGERLPSAVSETPKGAGPPTIQPPNRRGVGGGVSARGWGGEEVPSSGLHPFVPSPPIASIVPLPEPPPTPSLSQSQCSFIDVLCLPFRLPWRWPSPPTWRGCWHRRGRRRGGPGEMPTEERQSRPRMGGEGARRGGWRSRRSSWGCGGGIGRGGCGQGM